MRDGTGRTTSEDRATQLLIWETLSLAIYDIWEIYMIMIQGLNTNSHKEAVFGIFSPPTPPQIKKVFREEKPNLD